MHPPGYLNLVRVIESCSANWAARTHPAQPPELILNNGQQAVWQVRLGCGEAFMRFDRTRCDDLAHIVYCDANRFYGLWLATRGGHWLLRSRMPTDYKFNRAVDGFKPGRSNPVPLANVARAKPVGFTNGITRTYWLLSHHARSFPVVCAEAQVAEELHALVGIGAKPIPAAELFSTAAVAGHLATPPEIVA